MYSGCVASRLARVASYPTQTLQTWITEAEKAASRAVAGPLGAGSPANALKTVLDGHSNYGWDVFVTPEVAMQSPLPMTGAARVWGLRTGLLRVSYHRKMPTGSAHCPLAVPARGNLRASGLASPEGCESTRL